MDANIALRWFVPHAQSESAERLLAGEYALLAPDLIIPELTNAATTLTRNHVIPYQLGARIATDAQTIFQYLAPSTDLASSAFEIAAKLAHPAYDCFYLALAVRENTRMVTADKKLLNRLKDTKWAKFSCTLDAL